jgi:oxygen-dependent protoporphyrinogen oxidase
MRVVVVGAGISGLALAHVLTRRATAPGVDVTVLEAASRAGGVVRSERVDGFLCEHGPNGFLDGAEDTLRLVDELGIRDRLVPSSDAARRRFVYRAGRLRELPTGPGSFLAGDILSLGGRVRLLLEPFVGAGSQEDESVHAFVSRRFGREAASVMADAMTTGIFGGGSRELSIRACLPQVWQLEAEYGGIVRGLIRRRRSQRASGQARGKAPAGSSFGRLTSCADGIEELLAALARSVGPRLRLSAAADRIDRSGNGWVVRTSDGAGYAADHLVLAIRAPAAARLVEGLDAALAAELREIRSSPIAVLCLGYEASAKGARFDGFGFLVPQGEGPRILGAVWDSSIFPNRAPAGHALVRVLMGGGRDPGALALGDEDIVAAARADLRRVCGLDAAPVFVRVIRQVPGLPQYVVGHPARLTRLDRYLAAHPGLQLAGNSYRGLALNACITEARRTADAILPSERTAGLGS